MQPVMQGVMQPVMQGVMQPVIYPVMQGVIYGVIYRDFWLDLFRLILSDFKQLSATS